MEEHVGPLHDPPWVILVDQHVEGIVVPLIEAPTEEMARSPRLARHEPASLHR